MSNKNKRLYYATAKININYIEETIYISYYAYNNKNAKDIIKDKFRDNYGNMVNYMHDFKLHEE